MIDETAAAFRGDGGCDPPETRPADAPEPGAWTHAVRSDPQYPRGPVDSASNAVVSDGQFPGTSPAPARRSVPRKERSCDVPRREAAVRRRAHAGRSARGGARQHELRTRVA